MLLRWGDHSKELSAGYRKTTNNRMELLGAITGLGSLTRPCRVVLVSDSEYLRKGMTQWMASWKRNGWKNASKQPVKNADLWKRLDQLASYHQVQWKWVRGHVGHPENERCDLLARTAAQSAATLTDDGFEQASR